MFGDFIILINQTSTIYRRKPLIIVLYKNEMTQNLYDAHRQWAVRPADECFRNLEELYNHTLTRKNNSSQYVSSLDKLVVNVTPEDGISISNNSHNSTLTNWAFAQLCRAIGAPAKYLRSLTPSMAGDCLQYGMNKNKVKCNLLERVEYPEVNGNFVTWTSAITSPSYGRIWDADVVENLMNAIEGSSWHPPDSEKPLNRKGLYASDRDFFAFMINDENPIEIGNAKLGRGFFCWNSETGASTMGLTTFLYNYICKNHIVYGAEDINELRIIHKSQAPDRFYYNALPILNRFVENKQFGGKLKTTVNNAMNHNIGKNLEDIQNWFKTKSFTKNEIVSGYKTGLKEGEDVTNIWGMIQGITAYAREIPYIDKRVSLEKRAGNLLSSI